MSVSNNKDNEPIKLVEHHLKRKIRSFVMIRLFKLIQQKLAYFEQKFSEMQLKAG
jgi:hypothetical protein